MTSRCSIQAALLVCFSTTVLALNYDLLRFQLSLSSVKCQELLLQLNGTSKDCLKDRTHFKIPEELEKSQRFQKEDIVLVTLEMFQKTSNIFRRNFSSTGWNETIVENLLAIIHWQKDHLEEILEEILEEENFTWDHRTLLHLKRYYLRIVRYLKARDYSVCAWTIVQAEILKSFFFLDKLTGYLSN